MESANAIKILDAHRKGQWKSKWYNLFYYCSECANPSTCKYNFCPHCGADMRES